MERRLEITLKRSAIGRNRKQKDILTGIGLRKLNHKVVRKDCPEIRCMMAKVIHLIEWKELAADAVPE